MAITSGFFNSMSSDRKYNAEQIGNYFEGLVGNGVFENVGNKLVVRATNGLSISIGTGRAMINCHWIKNDTALTLTLDSGDVQYDRIDAVILKLDLNNSAREITIEIKKGTPSISPVRPGLQRSDNIYELCLATIKIPKGATNITQTNITDRRGNTKLCGYVTGLINQVDTDDLFLQYQTALEEYYEQATSRLDAIIAQKTQAFNDWFSTLTEELKVDTTITCHKNTVEIAEDSQEIQIGIPEYETGDVLFVYINGIMLVENKEYFVTNDRILLTNAAEQGNTITFIVLKSVIGNSILLSGQAIDILSGVNTSISGIVTGGE